MSLIRTYLPVSLAIHNYQLTAHPVQNSGHHAHGSVDFRSAVHRRTPTAPSDDAVSAVHRCPRLSVPWTRTETAKRAFCVAAPNVWTRTLPNDIRNASLLSAFRANLKTLFYCCVLMMNLPSAPLYTVITFTVVKLFSKFLNLATSHIFLRLLMYSNCPPHLNYVTTLPCENYNNKIGQF